MERTFVGLDVHARSVVACALDDRTGELSKARLVPDNETILAWLQQLAGPVAVVYEAGPTGYGLARFLTGRGVRCVVAAPSKMHRPSGDRVKTDARDALLLARLLRLGEITPVTVPSLAQEAARDLVRVREDVRADLMRARHRTSKLLLRQGIVWSGGTAWTGAHEQWLGQQRFICLACRRLMTRRWRPCCWRPHAATGSTRPSSRWPTSRSGGRRCPACSACAGSRR